MVNKKDLPKIFNNSTLRGLFISDYQFFNVDGNDDFYVEFIERYIYNNHSRRQLDAIELTIVLHLFIERYFGVIRAAVYSNRNDWLKLLCLDWMFNFKKNIQKEDFISLNSQFLKKDIDGILKLQAVLNLLQLEDQFDKISMLNDLMLNSKDIAYKSRLKIALDRGVFNQKIAKEMKNILSNAI